LACVSLLLIREFSTIFHVWIVILLFEEIFPRWYARVKFFCGKRRASSMIEEEFSHRRKETRTNLSVFLSACGEPPYVNMWMKDGFPLELTIDN
jgi:hypothetical protein